MNRQECVLIDGRGWDICTPGLKYTSLATPKLAFSVDPSAVELDFAAACARRLARLASASRPSGFRVLSGSECILGDVGMMWCEEWCMRSGDGGGEGELMRACVFWVCSVGDGDRESIPDAMLGFPRERRTVSRVRSILRKDRVRISCFLGKGLTSGEGLDRDGTYFVERFPRLDSSKIHSWFPV